LKHKWPTRKKTEKKETGKKKKRKRKDKKGRNLDVKDAYWM
jgi:hypothetical protein